MKEWLEAESPTDTAEFYDRKYKESGIGAFTGSKYEFFFDEFKPLFGNPRPTDRLLDCGCGHGEFFENVLSRYKFSSPSMVGVDISQEAISLAKNKFKNYEYEFEFLLGSFEVMRFSNIFDIVTCWGSIEHSMNPHEALKRMLAALVPGGILMITVPLEFENCLSYIKDEPFNKNNERFMTHMEWLAYFREVKKPIMTKVVNWPDNDDLLLVFKK